MKLVVFASLFGVLAYLFMKNPLPTDVHEFALTHRFSHNLLHIVFELTKPLAVFGIIEQHDFFRTFLNNIPSFVGSIPQNVEIKNIVLEGIPVRVFTPTSWKRNTAGLLYFNGGGFVFRTQSRYDLFLSNLATDANVKVIQVFYRLAPEHKFPSAFDDCYKVSRAVLSNSAIFGLHPKKIFLSGDSAGGNLATSVALQISLNELSLSKQIAGVIPIAPALQGVDTHLPSYKEHKTPGILPFSAGYYNAMNAPSTFTQAIADAFDNNRHLPFALKIKYQPRVNHLLLPKEFIPKDYVAQDLASDFDMAVPETYINYISDTRAFPLLAEDSQLRNFPRSLIIACELDCLRDEAIIFAERLRKESVPTRLVYLEKGVHIEPVLYFSVHQSQVGLKGYKEILRFIDEVLAEIK